MNRKRNSATAEQNRRGRSDSDRSGHAKNASIEGGRGGGDGAEQDEMSREFRSIILPVSVTKGKKYRDGEEDASRAFASLKKSVCDDQKKKKVKLERHGGATRHEMSQLKKLNSKLQKTRLKLQECYDKVMRENGEGSGRENSRVVMLKTSELSTIINCLKEVDEHSALVQQNVDATCDLIKLNVEELEQLENDRRDYMVDLFEMSQRGFAYAPDPNRSNPLLNTHLV